MQIRSEVFVQKLLTNKQTNNDEDITSLAEVVNPVYIVKNTQNDAFTNCTEHIHDEHNKIMTQNNYYTHTYTVTQNTEPVATVKKNVNFSQGNVATHLGAGSLTINFLLIYRRDQSGRILKKMLGYRRGTARRYQ